MPLFRLLVRTMQVRGDQHIHQIGLAGPASFTSGTEERDRAVPGGASHQPDALELARPNIQTIVEHLGASLAMELPYHPSMMPMGRPTSAESAPVASAETAQTASGEAVAEEEVAEDRTNAQGALSAGTQDLTEEERREVEKLKDRDREVRAHEQAHMAAAGPYSQGGPTYEYERGPDNRQYAVGGEVQIDTSEIADDPEATIRKAQTIRRAALAPAEPSPQDRRVAAEAAQMESKARQELSQQRLEEMQGVDEARETRGTDSAAGAGAAAESSQSTAAPEAPTASDNGKFVSGEADGAGELFDLVA